MILFELNQYLLLFLRPTMQSDFVPLQAEPLEEAGLCSCAWDQRGNEFPAFDHVVDVRYGESILLAMLANEPNKNFEVAYTPIPFEFSCLGHPS
jgi:hypothetical protein